jgi:hypothetical protein
MLDDASFKVIQRNWVIMLNGYLVPLSSVVSSSASLF